MKLAWILLGSTVLAQSVPPAPPSAREAMRAAVEKQQAAATRQRESIRKQAESVGAWLPPGNTQTVSAEPADPAMPCDPLPAATAAPLIDGAARSQSVEPRLLRAVIEQESGFHPCAVSPKGAKGLMQLMPDTAGELGVQDPFDPKENIDAGARYLKQLLDRYKGDLSQALGAYNAGPSAVDQAGGIPDIQETRDYVKAILQKLRPTQTDPPSIPPPKPIEN